MPYKDPIRLKEYKNEWRRKKRAAVLAARRCGKCSGQVEKRARENCAGCQAESRRQNEAARERGQVRRSQKRTGWARWKLINIKVYLHRESVRMESRTRFGAASEHPCLDCLSEGVEKITTEWDHWDGYDKPESVWHIEPVCHRHNQIRDVQRANIRRQQ